MKLGWHANALHDVEAILAHVSTRSQSGARSVSYSIERAADICSLVPYAGAKTNRSNIFRSPLADRRITLFYRVHPEQDLVEILRVVRSGRVKNLRRSPRD